MAGEAIVNQRFADTYFAGKNPIGQSITLGAQASSKAGSDVLIIVGVSPTLRQRLRLELEPIVYVPYRSTAPSTMSLLVRNGTDIAALVPVCVGKYRRSIRTFLSIASRRCGR